jgi:uncharacterized repeat protein (TIGR02543 family)
VSLIDSAGNTGSVKGEVKRIDKDAPKFLNISDGSFYNHSLTYINTKNNVYSGDNDFAISDANVKYITVNGVEVPNSARYGTQFSLTDDGTYVIVAYDKAGNSTSLTTTIDTVPPIITDLSLNDETISANDSNTLILKGTVTDANLSNYKCRLYQDNAVIARYYPGGTANVSDGQLCSFDVSNLSDGSYSVRIWANDKAGNNNGSNGTDTHYLAFTIDRTVRVTFETNGGSGVDAVPPFDAGGVISRPADPTRAGYTFAGWYSDAELTQPFDFNTPVSADLTLYAKWTQNSSADTSQPSGDSGSTDAQNSDTKPSVNLTQPIRQITQSSTPTYTVIAQNSAENSQSTTTTSANQTTRSAGETNSDSGSTSDADVLGAQDNRKWASANLVLALATALIGIVMVILGAVARNKRDEQLNRHWPARTVTAVIAVAALVIFALTEDWKLALGLVDGWTWLLVGLLLAQIVAAVLARAQRNDADN